MENDSIIEGERIVMRGSGDACFEKVCPGPIGAAWLLDVNRAAWAALRYPDGS